MTDEVLLTATEVAALARVTPDTITEWARKGRLPGRRIGGQWRFVARDIAHHFGLDGSADGDGR